MSRSFRNKIIFLFVTVGLAIVLSAKLSTRQESRLAEEQFRRTMTNIVVTMKTQFSKTGRYPSADAEYFLKVLSSSSSATNSSMFFYLKPWNTRTNNFEGFLDNWGMPLRMEMAGETNFILRSAGPDQKYDDADDIVFNSASNSFVKP